MSIAGVTGTDFKVGQLKLTLIVEYHDPSGVYSLVESELHSRLPLRNLHWKSPKRPLRSIESLHVELAKNPDAADSSRPSSLQSQGQPAVRRHQIPGLRQTPYLKLYLLRCDDSDSYKSTYRKAVREWLKSHTPASQSSSKKNSQENHDAFEWMILHVVFPNTTAAKESGQDASNEPAADRPAKLNKTSSTLLEKLKADFNHSSKSAPDRVAQVRLSNENLQNRKPGAKSTLVQEQREEWDDVVSKLKALILASFDLRVGQYEEDIREKDSQRILPGWNFCTFFVLKEGLARGFESVGLIDDALAGYEELNAELDSVISSEGKEPTDMFLPYTEELKTLYVDAQEQSSSGSTTWSGENKPISATRKNFRELILANNISKFDFKVYVLARKMAVLLRMSRTPEKAENLVPLGQLCQIGASDIPSISRIIAQDIRESVRDLQRNEDQDIVENIVASWAYSASQQILDETSSMFVLTSGPSEPSFSSVLEDEESAYPARSSSLSPDLKASAVDEAQALFDRLKGRAGNQNRSGRDFLASQRAQLVILQRTTLKHTAFRYGYQIGWSEKLNQEHGSSALSDVDLSDEDDPGEKRQSIQMLPKKLLDGIYCDPLMRAVVSQRELKSSFEALTTKALDLFFTSGQGKNFERMLADIALLKYQSGDYSGAANFFGKIIPIYSELDWSLLSSEMLLMHAKCLKVLNRKDDYIRMLLGLLAKSVQQNSLRLRNLHLSLVSEDIEQYTIDGRNILPELLAYSAQLPYDITVDMATYFQNIAVDPYIRHYQERDGFFLKLKFKSSFATALQIDRAIVTLLSVDHGSSGEIVLESNGPELVSGSSTIKVHSHVMTHGCFVVRKIVLHSGRIVFADELDLQDQSDGDSGRTTVKQAPTRILCYPRSDTLEIKTATSRTIHIDKPRCVEISCINGNNGYESLELKIRSASSGLRLHIAEATLMEGDVVFNAKPGSVTIQRLNVHQTLKFKLPYDLEDNHKDISLRIDALSPTPKLEYTSIQKVTVELPLDVNVHDLFKPSHILSRFHVRSSDMPLEIQHISLRDTDAFAVESPPAIRLPVMVFAKQPATFMYKLHQRKNENGQRPPRESADQERPLTLTVDYQSVDEIARNAVLTKMTSDLRKSDLKFLIRLLAKFAAERLEMLFAVRDYGEFAMTGEVVIPKFVAFGWTTITSQLERRLGESLNAWLGDWHEKNQTCNLGQRGGKHSGELLKRKILISVPLPRLHVLQTAHIIPNIPASNVVSVGLPISTTLTLKHTRCWESPFNVPGETEGSLDFVLDVDAPQDTWLIGGNRRIQFRSKEGESSSWNIILVPMRTGQLSLPSVDIRLVGQNIEEMSCETEYKGLGQRLTVVGNLQSTSLIMKESDAVLISGQVL